MIRKAGPADAETLERLMRAYHAYDSITADESRLRPAIEQLLADPSLGFAFVAEVGGQVTGYAIGAWMWEAEFGGRAVILTDLYVEGTHRGAGFGRALLAAVEQEAKEGGAGAIEGQVIRGNERAQAFYRQWGFQFPDRMLMSRRLGEQAEEATTSP